MGRVRRHVHRQPADRDLAGWRIERLSEAGFGRSLAGRLAGDDRYDLHRLLELVDLGCPPELAARILAPLDEEAPR